MLADLLEAGADPHRNCEIQNKNIGNDTTGRHTSGLAVTPLSVAIYCAMDRVGELWIAEWMLDKWPINRTQACKNARYLHQVVDRPWTRALMTGRVALVQGRSTTWCRYLAFLQACVR